MNCRYNPEHTQIERVTEPKVYDGVLYYRCKTCGGTFHRWREGTAQYERAKQFIHEPVEVQHG